MEREKIIKLMAARRLFAGASEEEMGFLVDCGEVVEINQGEIMIEQGKVGEAVWILLDGTVIIRVDEQEAHQVDVPGTVLGEISAVSQTAATATVVAESDLSALRIAHADFHRALSASSELAASVLRSMSKYLK